MLLSSKLSAPRLPTFLVERSRLLTDLDAVVSSFDARLGHCRQWQDHAALGMGRRKAKNSDDALLPFTF